MAIPASVVALAPILQTATVSTPVRYPPGVRVTDADGFPMAGVTVTWTITGGGGSKVPTGTTTTDSLGASYLTSWTLGASTGVNTLQATVAGLDPVTFQATGTTLVATTIAAISSTAQTATIGTAVAQPPTVLVSGTGGAPAAGETVTFTVTSGGGTLNGASTVLVKTGADGIAQAPAWVLGITAGDNLVEATVSYLTLTGEPVVFSATGVLAGTATTIAAISPTSQTAQVSTDVTRPPGVLVTDASGNPVEGVTVTFAVTAGGGSINATTVVTDAAGLARLTRWTLGSSPGSSNNTVTATKVGLTGSPVTFTASAVAVIGALSAAQYRDALYVASVEKLYLSGGAQTSGGTGNLVRVFDAKTLVHITDIVVGDGCRGLAYANGKVYVARNGAIGVIATATDTLSTTITIAGSWHRGVYVSTVDRVVFVQDTTGSIIRVNPNDDTQSQLVASKQTIGLIAYSTSNDRLYVPESSNNMAVINPSTGATDTTISGGMAFGNAFETCLYSPINDRVYVNGSSGGGGEGRVAVVNPSTNTVVTHIVLATTGDYLSGVYSADQERIYIIHTLTIGQEPSEIVEIDPATNTVLREDPAAPGINLLVGYMPGHGSFWQLHSASGQPAVLWNVYTYSSAVRTLIEDSNVEAPHVTVTLAKPIGPGDLVLVRRDALGSFRRGLEWPASIDLMGGQRWERMLIDDEVRGERNWVVNPWARDWWDAYRPKGGWMVPTSHESKWYGRDSSAWLSTSATVDGSHSSGISFVSYRGLTAGDVIEPGDWLVTVGRFAAKRAVVGGDGKVTITVNAVTGSAYSDGANHTIRRPPAPDWLVDGQGVVIPAYNGGTAEASVVFAVPYLEGLTTLWGTLEAYLWLADNTGGGNLKPSDRLALRTFTGSVQKNETFAGDTTVYTDTGVLTGPHIISYQHVLEPGDYMRLTARVTASTGNTVVLYIRRFQATLGPEANVQPPMEINANEGALFHAGQRALRDRGSVPYQFVGSAVEGDTPFVVGGYVELRHPDLGIVATPRCLSVTRTITPNSTEPDIPEVVLDNYPASLTKRLAAQGLS